MLMNVLLCEKGGSRDADFPVDVTLIRPGHPYCTVILSIALSLHTVHEQCNPSYESLDNMCFEFKQRAARIFSTCFDDPQAHRETENMSELPITVKKFPITLVERASFCVDVGVHYSH